MRTTKQYETPAVKAGGSVVDATRQNIMSGIEADQEPRYPTASIGFGI